MKNRGLRVLVGNRDLKSLVSKVGGFRGALAKFQSELAHTDSCYLSWIKTAVVADAKHRSSSSSVALHEYGQGVHHMLLTSFAGQNVIDAHKRLHPHLPPFIQERGEPGSFGGVAELIADSFADFHILSKEDFLKRYDEQWYLLLGKIIADNSIE